MRRRGRCSCSGGPPSGPAWTPGCSASSSPSTSSTSRRRWPPAGGGTRRSSGSGRARSSRSATASSRAGASAQLPVDRGAGPVVWRHSRHRPQLPRPPAPARHRGPRGRPVLAGAGRSPHLLRHVHRRRPLVHVPVLDDAEVRLPRGPRPPRRAQGAAAAPRRPRHRAARGPHPPDDRRPPPPVRDGGLRDPPAAGGVRGGGRISLPLNALLFAVDNLIFLLFPSRPAAVSPGDFQILGRQIIVLAGKGISLAVLAMPAFLIAFFVYVLTNQSLVWFVVAAVPLLLGEAAALVPVIAWAFAASTRAPTRPHDDATRMHIQTHLMSGWCVGNCFPLTPRQERLGCMLAASLADLDGLSLLFGQEAYWDYHHLLGHNLAFALLFCGVLTCFATHRLLAFTLYLTLAHLHLVLDYFGSGPGWPIHYLYPLSHVAISNPRAWEFYSWQNMTAAGLLLLWTIRIARRLGPHAPRSGYAEPRPPTRPVAPGPAAAPRAQRRPIRTCGPLRTPTPSCRASCGPPFAVTTTVVPEPAAHNGTARRWDVGSPFPCGVTPPWPRSSTSSRTSPGPGFNRWLVPPAALAIHLSIGQVYAFSVFKIPLTQAVGITHHVRRRTGRSRRSPGSSASRSRSWGSPRRCSADGSKTPGPRKAMFAAACCFGGGFLRRRPGRPAAPALAALPRLRRARRDRAGARIHLAGLDADQVVPRPARHGDRAGHHGLRRRRDDRRPAGRSASWRTSQSATRVGVAQTLVVMGIIYFCFMMFGVFTDPHPAARTGSPRGVTPPREAIGHDHHAQRRRRHRHAHAAVLAAVGRALH